MKRYSTRNESPRPFEDLADPEALPLPRGPDSRTFRLLLNGSDPYLQRVAELVRRLWIKQRPRQDAEAVLAQVLEDLTEGRYALRHLAAYVSALPLVASPCHRLAEMIADYYGLCADEPRAAGEDADVEGGRAVGSLAHRASPRHGARRARLPAAQDAEGSAVILTKSQRL